MFRDHQSMEILQLLPAEKGWQAVIFFNQKGYNGEDYLIEYEDLVFWALVKNKYGHTEIAGIYNCEDELTGMTPILNGNPSLLGFKSPKDLRGEEFWKERAEEFLGFDEDTDYDDEIDRKAKILVTHRFKKVKNELWEQALKEVKQSLTPSES